MPAKKRSVTGVVRKNKEVAPGFFKMTIAAPEVAGAFKPGQFFQIRVNAVGSTQPASIPLLRRPFAPSETDGESFAFTYAVVGNGTEALTTLKAGIPVEILAPLGNGYTLPRKGSRAVLVGGGCGTPSLRYLGETLKARGVEVFSVIGAKTACTLLEKNALKRLSTLLALSTDDGSTGFHGHAVAATEILLGEIGPGTRPHLFACGPHPMLRGLAALAEARNLPCEVSLEERMACGFGACMGCAVKVKADNYDGFLYKRVCHDGPVFPSRELLF